MGEMAVARDIEILPSAFLVGKRKPVSELPQPWRWLARFVYQRTGWASDYGIETQAICTSRELAEALCAKNPNWFIQELPINTPLPDESCKFRLMSFPNSDAARLYEKRIAPFVAIPRKDVSQLIAVDVKLGQLQETIEEKCARAL